MKAKGFLILFCAVFWESTIAGKSFRVPATSYGVPINNPEEIKLISDIYNAHENIPSSEYGLPLENQKTIIPQRIYGPPQDRVVIPQPFHSSEQLNFPAVPKPSSTKRLFIPHIAYGVPQKTVEQFQTSYTVQEQNRATVKQQQQIQVPHTTYGTPEERIELPVKPQFTYEPPVVKRPPVFPAVHNIVAPTRIYDFKPEIKVVVPQLIYYVPQLIQIPAEEYGLIGRKALINFIQR